MLWVRPHLTNADTSRPPRVLEENGKNYWFIDREDMDREINEHKFLEHGEYNGNIYGTHLDSIRDVIKQGMNGINFMRCELSHYSNDATSERIKCFRSICVGKMCVLDCAPNALKMLHHSTEFMPFVIFIAAPGMEQLKQLYAERRATGGSQRNLSVSGRRTELYVCSID